MTLSSAAASRHRRSVMYRKYCIIGETIRLLQQEIQKAKCMLMKQACSGTGHYDRLGIKAKVSMTENWGRYRTELQ